LQARNATVMVITHRVPILQVTNKLMLLQEGVVRMFGPTGEVMQALQKQVAGAGAASIDNQGAKS